MHQLSNDAPHCLGKGHLLTAVSSNTFNLAKSVGEMQFFIAFIIIVLRD